MPFERYKFYSRMQESGVRVLRLLLDSSSTVTPNQILRDKLVFGIRDSKVREKNLSLQETDEICRSHETMVQQMKVVGDAGLSVANAGNVNAVSKKPKKGNVGAFVAREMLTRGEIVVNFADVSMT